MKKYMTKKYGVIIEKVEVERETESSIWTDGVRNAKRSGWSNFFDTFDEAKDFLMKESESHLLYNEKRLEAAKNRLAEVKALENDNE